MTRHELLDKVEDEIDIGDYEPRRQAKIAIRIVIEACVNEALFESRACWLSNNAPGACEAVAERIRKLGEP